MRKAYLAPIMLLISSFAFATGHCGNDPTKPDPVPSRCNGIVHQPFNFTVLSCYGKDFCTLYNRAAEVLMLTPMHGRHGHGDHGWTAYMQWDVPPDLRREQLVISVAPGLDVFLNGRKLTENRPGEYTIDFSEGYLVLTPSETQEGAELHLPEYGIL